MTHRNGFLLFISSCLSGCGQMYQGYMKRGLSLLLDRQTIIDSFYNGYGLAAGGFLNYTSAFYREQPVQHDPERGAELLREVV